MEKGNDMSYTYDERIVSDLHKDAYGSRPREGFWNKWEAASNDERQAIWDDLCQIFMQRETEERIAEELAIAEFEARVAELMDMGADDRTQAIRWIIQGMGIDESGRGGMWHVYEELEWQLGLPFGYLPRD